MKVIVDSSIWIDHLQKSNSALAKLLQDGQVFIHPAVLGELACGSIKNRARFLDSLLELPELEEPAFAGALKMIESENLWGKGLGWIDVQLLATARHQRAVLWTKDRALALAASQAGVFFDPAN